MKNRKSMVRKLGAYTLAAGAAAGLAAKTASADMVVYKPCTPGIWYDATSNWEQDMIMFKTDGTVVLNTADTGLQSLGQDANSFTFSERDFFWWGTEEKDAICLNIGENLGFVAGVADVWNVGRLGDGYKVGPTLADGRVWSDRAVTDTGGLGGWNFYFAGEWPFGGGGYIGLYFDVGTDRHYGWCEVNAGSYLDIELVQFGFERVPGKVSYTPEPMTLGLLALGATGLLMRRKRV